MSPILATGLKNRVFSLSEIDGVIEQFAPWMCPPRVVTFSGELGSGKTTLIAALLKHYFGLEMAASPTFTLALDYGAVVHFDLYRLTDPDEFERMGWDEAFERVALIEWPERLEGRLPGKRVEVRLEHVDENRRRISIDEAS